MTGLRALVPLVGAAALTVVAVLTARDAGCDDPGHYELRAGGYELVGGCIAPGDLVVPRAPVAPPLGVVPDTSPARS